MQQKCGGTTEQGCQGYGELLTTNNTLRGALPKYPAQALRLALVAAYQQAIKAPTNNTYKLKDDREIGTQTITE